MLGGMGMNMTILQITATKKPPYRTKMGIRSSWLADMGFVYGAPVRAIPLTDGFILALQDEHNQHSGKLIHVGLDGTKLALTLNFAKNFSVTGLTAGDFLAARYEYGVITARKLPPAQKYYVVGSQNYGPFLRLCGAWLNDAGFLPDTIAMVAVQPGCLTLRLCNDPAASYAEIVKFARAHRYQVLQAQRNQNITIMDLDGYTLSHAGFDTGNIIGIHYKHGRITLFKPDLQKLGF